MDRLQLLREYIQRRAKRYEEQEKALVKSLGGPDLPDASKWDFRDRGYLQGCLSTCDMIEDFIDRKLKSTWSEEDDKNLEKTIWYIEKGGKLIFAKNDKLVSWLKSLKDRVDCEANCTTMWKPSKEQVKVLEFFIPYVTKCSVVLQKSKDTLLSLLADLKKLREE